MKKTFTDNYVLYEADVVDKDGNKKSFKAVTLTNDSISKIPTLLNRYDSTITLKGKIKLLTKVMSLIFGDKPKDYYIYSVRLMWDIINDFVQEIQKRGKENENPTGSSKGVLKS